MAQDRYDMELNAGATFRHGIVPALQADDGTVVDYDLTGALFRLYVRDERRRTVATFTPVAAHDDALDQDVIRLELTAEQTSQFAPHRRYFYILDMIHPSGDVERILDGALRVRPFTSGGING